MAMPIPSAEYWTAADLDHMPEDGLRYEVLNGQLIVNAAPKPIHQWFIQRLLLSLLVAAPEGYRVLTGVGVLLGEDEPIPDLVVTTGPVPWQDRGIPVENVALAVEVVSRSTTMTDRTLKPPLYSSGGIPHYWRCEINSFKGRLPGEALPVVFAYSLSSEGGYELTHRASAGQQVTLYSPFEVTFDPASLVAELDS